MVAGSGTKSRSKQGTNKMNASKITRIEYLKGLIMSGKTFTEALELWTNRFVAKGKTTFVDDWKEACHEFTEETKRLQPTMTGRLRAITEHALKLARERAESGEPVTELLKCVELLSKLYNIGGEGSDEVKNIRVLLPEDLRKTFNEVTEDLDKR